jgi:ATP-dependent 26S proteasome regulatory subunit
MKNILMYFSLIVFCMVVPVQKTKAADPILQLIKEAVIKVIKEIDLQVQRLQNKTIWLQNAQKTIENKLSELKLNEIRDWVEKQRKQYEDYFDELWKVKTAILYLKTVKEIIDKQINLVKEYKQAWVVFQRDKHFSNEELQYMFSVYSGIMEQSLKNIDHLTLVISSFETQMSDAKRLEMIQAIAGTLDEQYADLRNFNNQNRVIAIQRGLEKGEIDHVRKLYALPLN